MKEFPLGGRERDKEVNGDLGKEVNCQSTTCYGGERRGCAVLSVVGATVSVPEVVVQRMVPVYDPQPEGRRREIGSRIIVGYLDSCCEIRGRCLLYSA